MHLDQSLEHQPDVIDAFDIEDHGQTLCAGQVHVSNTGRRQDQRNAAVREIGRVLTGVSGDSWNLSDLDRLFRTVKDKREHYEQTIGVNVKANYCLPP